MQFLNSAYFGPEGSDSSFEMPPSPSYEETVGSLHNAKIDQAKYRTRMCRNYLMGVPCPFESRCVFAHGDVQLRAQDLPPTYDSLVDSMMNSPTVGTPDTSRPTTPPSYPTRFRYDPYTAIGIVFECA